MKNLKVVYKRIHNKGIVSWQPLCQIKPDGSPKRFCDFLIKEGHLQGYPKNPEKLFADLWSCGMVLTSEIALLLGDCDD